MVTSLGMRSNQTSKNTSQEELRDLLSKSPAAHRFLVLFGTPLEEFVGNIPEHRIPTVSGAGLPARFPPASAIASPG